MIPFLIPQSNANCFYWGHQCSWTFTPADGRQIYNMDWKSCCALTWPKDHHHHSPPISKNLQYLRCFRLISEHCEWVGRMIRLDQNSRICHKSFAALTGCSPLHDSCLFYAAGAIKFSNMLNNIASALHIFRRSHTERAPLRLKIICRLFLPTNVNDGIIKTTP